MKNLQYGQFPGINKEENVNHCKRCVLDVLMRVLPSSNPEHFIKIQLNSVLPFLYLQSCLLNRPHRGNCVHVVCFSAFSAVLCLLGRSACGFPLSYVVALSLGCRLPSLGGEQLMQPTTVGSGTPGGRQSRGLAYSTAHCALAGGLKNWREHLKLQHKCQSRRDIIFK